MPQRMKTPAQPLEQQREELLRQIQQLARRAVFGTISETYRTCGTPSCACHHKGPKHGPHLYISYRGSSGKTTGYYVPKNIQTEVRQGVQAWGQLQENLRQMAQLNKDRLLPEGARKKRHFATGSS